MRCLSWIRTIFAILVFVPLAGYLHVRNALADWKSKETFAPTPANKEPQHDCHAIHLR